MKAVRMNNISERESQSLSFIWHSSQGKNIQNSTKASRIITMLGKPRRKDFKR